MKTGYFYNLRGNEIKGAVSIAVGNPRYVKMDLKMKELAPTWDLLQDFRAEKIDEQEYIRRFMKQLEQLDAEEVVKKLKEMAGDSEPVIMCHCNKESFCHRHIVAEWIEKETGEKMEEYSAGEVERVAGRLV